ncbi:ferric reductase-like transmembrane domain-containing protein [Candidatus Collierbacteria bacterium]|nr:ferric reductase-like transmembrane domain-containing protein [Candidatus Collierbacteria bacterium]
MKETLRQYLVAGLVSIATAGGLILYLTARRGYFDLSIVNKSLASTSLILLGIVLLLGPLSRIYNRFDKWINYRKELGILAFLTGAVHVYLSMFPLARRGPFGLYQSRPLVAYTGLLGLVIMTYLFIISFEKIKQKIGMAKWWKMQYWGARITGVAIFTHMAVFKYPEWNTWLGGEAGKLARPGWPPASLLTAIFISFVFLTRFSELLGAKTAKFLTPVWLAAAVIISVLLFKL